MIKNYQFLKQHKVKYAISLGLLISIITGITYWHSLHKAVEVEKVAVTKPWHESVNIKKEYVAQIKAFQHIEIRSLEKGYLQKIYVDEGQFVKKGQKMFEIMTSLLNAELGKASAEYRKTKIEYDNTKSLNDKNIVSASELALTRSRLDKAKAEMDLAATHVKLATVVAPFDGIMDRFYVRLGSLINEGDLLTNLSDNRKVWVYFNVSEVDYLDYMEQKKNHIDMPVELVLANGLLFNQKGKIDTIEADFNNEVGNVAFRASFANPDGLLRHGETGNIVISKKYENAMIIPQKATFEVLDKKFVFVVDGNNIIHDREIKILAELPYVFIIESGLKDEEMIMLEGIGKYREGDKITPNIQSSEIVKKNLNLIAN